MVLDKRDHSSGFVFFSDDGEWFLIDTIKSYNMLLNHLPDYFNGRRASQSHDYASFVVLSLLKNKLREMLSILREIGNTELEDNYLEAVANTLESYFDELRETFYRKDQV